MAITHDATSSATSASGSFTYNHTLGSGANRLVVICVALNGSAGSLTVTYNGEAPILTVTETISTLRIFQGYILESSLPAAGTYVVSVAYTGSITGTGNSSGCSSFAGVKQQGPEATESNTSGVSAGSISVNITTLTANAWLIDALGVADSGGVVTAHTPGAGQVERIDWSTATIDGGIATKAVAAAGATTDSWTWSANSLPSALLVTSWAEAGSGPPPLKDIRRTTYRFTAPSSVSSVAYTGVGFPPKAILSNAIAVPDESVTGGQSVCIGMATAVAQKCCLMGAQATVLDVFRDRSQTLFLRLRNPVTDGLILEGSLTSLDDDGFTVNWTTVTGAGIGALCISEVFGGNDLKAEIQSAAVSAGLITGLGFQPEFGFAMSSCNTLASGLDSSFGTMTLGSFNAALQQFNITTTQTVLTQKETIVRSSGFAAQISAGAVTWEASIASITASGITWTGTDGDGIDVLFFNVGGIATDIRVWANNAAAAPTTQNMPTIGFERRGMFIACANRTAETLLGASSLSACWAIGSWSRGVQGHVLRTDVNGVNNADMRLTTGFVIGAGTTDAVYLTESVANPVPLTEPCTITHNPNSGAVLYGSDSWALQRFPDTGSGKTSTY